MKKLLKIKDYQHDNKLQIVKNLAEELKKESGEPLSNGKSYIKEARNIVDIAKLSIKQTEIELEWEDGVYGIEIINPKNELNLCELLKDCVGQKFYMPHYGDVILHSYDSNNDNEGILIFTDTTISIIVTKEGLSMTGINPSEMCVFPSKEQRDWSLFQPPWTPQKGERVWVSYEGTTKWYARYFNNKKGQIYYCFMQDNKTEESGFAWTKCVPFDQIPW